MAREVKIGIAVIGSLLLCLSGVIIWKMTRTGDTQIAAKPAASVEDGTSATGASPETTASATPSRMDPFQTSSSNLASSSDRYSQFGFANDASANNSSAAATPANTAATASDVSTSSEIAAGGETTSGASSSTIEVEDSATPIPSTADSAPATVTSGESASPAPGGGTAASNTLQPADNVQLSPRDGNDRYADIFAPQASQKTAATPAAGVNASTGAATADANKAQPSTATTGPSTTEANQVGGGTATAKGANGATTANASNRRPANDQKTLRPTDTLASFAEREYGDSAYAQVLAEHNATAFPDPKSIRAGATISAPTEDELARLYPQYFESEETYQARVAAEAKAATATETATSSSAGTGVENFNSIAAERSSPFDARTSSAPESRSDRGTEFADATRGAANTTARGVPVTYTVQPGDSLFDIARYHLGKASRWSEIYQLNRAQLGDRFDRLAPGTKLTLPAR